MKNSEIVKNIISAAEKEHKNLYHDISKEEIEEHIAKIKNLDNLSDIELDYELIKLFALFKDLHTVYKIPKIRIDQDIRFFKGKFYIVQADKWIELSSIGGKSCNVVYKKIKEITSYETKEWLDTMVDSEIYNYYVFKMLNLKNYVLTKSGDRIDIGISTKQGTSRPRPYKYTILNGNILYVKYSRSKENPARPFKKFVEDIAEQISKLNIKNYILDIRDNFGGNSEILNPFQELVRNKKLHGVLLINNVTASSAIITIARFKSEFNTPLIGEPTGGAATSYGEIKQIEVCGKQIVVSTEHFDFSKLFGYTGAIQPDILVETTIDDINSKHDPQLSAATDYLKNSTKTNGI